MKAEDWWQLADFHDKTSSQSEHVCAQYISMSWLGSKCISWLPQLVYELSANDTSYSQMAEACIEAELSSKKMPSWISVFLNITTSFPWFWLGMWFLNEGGDDWA